VNRAHLSAVIWLRIRLGLNQLKRGGALGTVLTILILATAVVAALFAFVIALAVGTVAFGEVGPDVVMLIWDGVVAAFLLFWVIGVVTELQRSEALSLDKLLHLPISPRGAFLLNYGSSLASLSIIVFAPAMAGLAIGAIVANGPAMLLLLPLALSILLMVTAVTYQFRGWLASLMVNKRRRGTIIAVVTLSIILLGQLPNLLIIGSNSGMSNDEEVAAAAVERMKEAGEIEGEREEQEALIEQQVLAMNTRRAREEKGQRETVRMLNLVLPPGWLPYGASALSAGNPWPAVLGTVGAVFIGTLSLSRSYRTTLRIYTGDYKTRRRRKKKATPKAADPKHATRVRLMEWRLPGCPEQAAAVALSGFKSLLRSPQIKMLLLTPVILFVVLGTMTMTRRESGLPPAAAPGLGLGVVSATVFFLAQILQNQFGVDRDGFRALVLSGARRRDILLGKNIALAPLVGVLGGIGLLVVQILVGMKVTHLAASFIQLACVFLISCLVGNLISILVPVAMSATSLKPAQPRSSVVLKQMVFMFLFPIAMMPSAIPLGLEMLLDAFERRGGVPIYLILSVIELAAVVWLYLKVLDAEGRLLQSREQRVLEEVTIKSD
jgi:hypothetical protein